MTTESITKLTAPAAKLWASITSDTQNHLLSNVWCGKCRHEVTITNFTGAVRSGDLLLVGKCSECHGDVASVIEIKSKDDDRISICQKLTYTHALSESELLNKELNAFNKRRRQLSKKCDDGAITKQEKAEFDGMIGKDGDKMINKFFEGFMKLANAK